MSEGLNRPAGAAGAAGLWQAGAAGFITPIGGTGISIAGPVQLQDMAAAPAAVAGSGHTYSLQVAGISELHWIDSAGNITQITGAGSLFHSLQDAYVDGQDIVTTGPLGSVTITNNIADASSCLELVRTLAVGGYALTVNPVMAIVDAGGVNLSTFTMNGTDLEVTNATLLGDMIFNSVVEIRQEINSVVRTILDTDEYTNQVAATFNSMYLDCYSATNAESNQFVFRKSDSNVLGTIAQTDNGDDIGWITWQGVNTTPLFALGATIHAVQNGASGVFVPTDIVMETYTNAAVWTDLLRLDAAGYVNMRPTALRIYDLAGGVNNSTFVMNGTDLEITNTTALGDIITNATVEIRQEINSVVRTILNGADYTNQLAAVSNIHYIDAYSNNPAHAPHIYLRRSNNNVLGTKTSTVNANVLGHIIFQGVDTGNNFDQGARITAIQNGAAGVRIPTDLILTTFSSTVENTNAFIIRYDGLHSFAFGEIQPVERVNDADHAVGFDDWYIAVHTLAANDRSVTIAAGQEIEGRVLNIKLEGAPAGQKVIINPNSNIEGAATLDLTVANQSVSIIYDGVQWQVFG